MRVILVIALAAVLFLSMLALCELGRRLGRRRYAQDPEGPPAGAGVVDGAVYALLGLLIAFTFASAASRFDARRQLIVDEANDIGTAWLRLDLLPADERAPLQDLMRRYLDSRLEVYRLLPDLAAAQREREHSAKLQNEIWLRAVAASQRADGQRATDVLLPALNAMFEIATTRTMVTRFHQPEIILALLIALSLVCSMLAGYSMGQGGSRRSWVHLGGFAAVMAFTVYVIIDLEFPRHGLIRVDPSDGILSDLRASMD